MAGKNDDIDLWKQIIEQVKPLNAPKPIPKPPVEQLFEKQAVVETPSYSPKPAKPVIMPELKIGARAGIDKNQRRKMDSGNIPIEDRIDLHGLTRIEASAVFSDFIERAYSEEKRMLLVITGKGYKSKYNKSVLKQELPRWLNQENLQGKILRFSSAQPRHGGDGAFYVLLKRKR